MASCSCNSPQRVVDQGNQQTSEDYFDSDMEKDCSACEARTLLDNDQACDRAETNFDKRSNRKRLWTVFIVLQVALIALNVAFSLMYTGYCWSKCHTVASGFLPVEKVLRQKNKTFEKKGSEQSPLSQPPSQHTEIAWARLLLGGNMRVTQSELAAYGPNATSVHVLLPPSGKSVSFDTREPQYLAKMGFYHELHCLHKMKRWLYPEAYFPNATEHFLDEERQHLEHCIEWIRTAALCRGDTTLTLFEWVDGMLETKYPIPHMCVDEDQLLAWSDVEGRMVDIDVDGMIEGPRLG